MSMLDILYRFVWGAPLLVLIMGLGLYLTIALKGLQFRYLWYALKLVLFPEKIPIHGEEKGDISHFQSLMTALAGSIGIGNIAGVSTALCVGGIGALFWMWITALLGMAIKYAEAILAVKYREEDEKGEMCGGPMYFVERGLGWKKLALSFALFGTIATFGGGNMLQANSVADVLLTTFHIDPLYSGIALACITGVILLGGIQSIGKAAAVLVPFMATFYISGGLIILIFSYDQIPAAIYAIFAHAFSGQAAFGGFAGSSLMVAMQVGMSRGLMTSEAGLGTASIAAAAARTDLPGRQAMVSMTGSFLATIVLCTVTGLVVTVTNVFGTLGVDGKLLNGATLTTAAFTSVLPWGGVIVAIALVLFALTTLLGWAYYGEKCVEYLFGVRAITLYRTLFTLVVIPGAVLDLEVVWKISDITNGLMAFPNLIGIVALSPVVIQETEYFLAVVRKEQLQMTT